MEMCRGIRAKGRICRAEVLERQRLWGEGIFKWAWSLVV